MSEDLILGINNKYVRDKIKNTKVIFDEKLGHFICRSNKTGAIHDIKFGSGNTYECDCEWHVMKTKPNKRDWGVCSHVLRLLYDFNIKEFQKELKLVNGRKKYKKSKVTFIE